MKKLILTLFLAVSACATTQASTNPNDYQESQTCPTVMSEEGHLSGVVRCRAMCSSYARDFAEYTDDCKCWCAPAGGASKGYGTPQRPNQNGYNNQS